MSATQHHMPVTYEKGLGVHAYSKVSYYLGGNCSFFTSDVGVDDEAGERGSVVFYPVTCDLDLSWLTCCGRLPTQRKQKSNLQRALDRQLVQASGEV